MLSESFEEDFSDFGLLLSFLGGVVILLEVDELDDDEDDDEEEEEVLESEDGGSSGKPAEHSWSFAREFSNPDNVSSSLSIDTSFIITMGSSIISSLLLFVMSSLFKDEIMDNNIFL